MSGELNHSMPKKREQLLDGAPRVSVGINTADLGRLNEEIALLSQVGVELIHVDLMDGVFCPMFTVGPPVVDAITTPLIKDVHLLVHDPLKHVESVVSAGADIVTFQVEGAQQPLRVLQAMREAGQGAGERRPVIRGVGVNPGTPLQVLEPLMDYTDYILILAINPGWRGQTFLASTAARVQRARRMIEESGRPILLGVDGGVTRDNVAEVVKLDPHIIVSGSAVFDGGDPAANARRILDVVKRGRAIRVMPGQESH